MTSGLAATACEDDSLALGGHGWRWDIQVHVGE